MTEKQRIDAVRKIKACLARADAERNANENERAIALRQANALMEKYSIQMIDLGDTDELGPLGSEETSIGAKPWKAVVYHAVGKLYAVRILYGKGLVTIVGRQHYRSIVIDMGQYVINSIEKEAKRAKGDKRYKASFRNGAAQGLYPTVDGILKERAKAHDNISESKALVLVDHFKKEMDLANQWMHDNMRVGRSRRMPGGSDARGYSDGHVYGSTINLGDQLGTSQPKGRLTNG
jgi:hypothetical protein